MKKSLIELQDAHAELELRLCGLLHGMPRNPMAQAITGYAPLCGPVAIARVIRTETGGEDISGWPVSEASRLWRGLFHLAEAM